MPESPADTNTPAIPREQQFVHLHLHTEYSLLDGGNRIDKLVARVVELGMNAVGITDHGNLFGAIAFASQCKEKGVKPILGVEAYVTPPGKPRTDRTYTGGGEGGYHLVLLCENNQGWNNLLYLCSEAFLTGFYYKPRIDREILERHNAGLIAINGHLGSEIGEHLLDYERTADEKCWNAAVESATWHKRVFADTGSGPRFYVELQHHVPEQNSINKHLIRLARETGCPLVCDNDAHFLRAQDHDAHDTLICISTGKQKSEENRMHYPPDVYVKSPQEMRALFEPYADAGREALDNTVAIAERCRVDLPLGKNNAPMVRVRVRDDDAPNLDDPRYAGDLTAWYKDYCARFEVVPFSLPDGASDEDRTRLLAEARAECDAALRKLAEAGYVWRYGAEEPHPADGTAPPPRSGRDKTAAAPTNAERRARLERELKILADKNISAYFLIVWDFVNWGRQRGIPALARGSGVGTMVGYVLGLSNACPVRYGLLFERFTDPDRSEYPDIDIDLCQDGRADVINHVREKYGHVAQIITFGTMKAKAAVRDVGRVLGMSLPDVDKIAKLVPEQLNITLDKALEQEPDFKKLYDADEQVRRLVDNARTLEGQARHASVHAAGVIVATRPLHEIVPLYRPAGADERDVVTQWDGPTCEKMGLLKMDFLGLRTLSVIERCKRLINESMHEREVWAAVGRERDHDLRHSSGTPPQTSAPHPLDLDRLDFRDQKVFEMFRRGDTTGVFQFESPGMRRLLVDMKPDRLEDLIAANALFRPGPMDLIPDYNRRKHGHAPVPSIHPIADKFVLETYGVMVYQEQVMQIVHELGGIPLRAAYSLIKAISKKKEKEIAKTKPVFVEGAKNKGLSTSAAEDLFENILKFAGYGFNKSHSTGYAIVAYQTAYLKTFFPAQYMAAFLTFESAANTVSDWIPYVEDAKKTRTIDPATGQIIRPAIEVRPPDVNKSKAAFAVVFDEHEPRDARHGHIRFGLAAIKGVGDKAIDAIIEERDRKATPFTSLFDFCERMTGRGPGVLTKTTVEALIKCGAFDSLHGTNARAAMVATIEQAIAAGQKAAADKASGQGALFGFGGESPAAAKSAAAASLAKATPWSTSEALSLEKEALGFYVSSHPLDAWRHWSSTFADATTASAKTLAKDKRVVIAGLIAGVRTLIVKNGRSAGQKMAAVTLEDQTGTVPCVMFSDAFAKFGHLAENDRIVFVLGRIDTSRGDVQILIERLAPIDGIPLQPGRLQVTIDEVKLNGGAPAVLQRVAGMIRDIGTPPKKSEAIGDDAPVMFPVELALATADRTAIMALPSNTRVRFDASIHKEFEHWLGEGCVRLVNGVWAEKMDSGPRWGNKDARSKPYRGSGDE